MTENLYELPDEIFGIQRLDLEYNCSLFLYYIVKPKLRLHILTFRFFFLNAISHSSLVPNVFVQENYIFFPSFIFLNLRGKLLLMREGIQF